MSGYLKNNYDNIENYNDLKNMEPNLSKIVSYLSLINFGKKFKKITNIENYELMSYYEHFLSLELSDGLYVLDSNGIYKTIDSGHFGICHLMRVNESEQNSIYAITDFSRTRIYFSENERYILLFVNVVKTRLGFSFLDNNFICNPIPGNRLAGKTIHTLQIERKSLTSFEAEEIDEEDYDESEMN